MSPVYQAYAWLGSAIVAEVIGTSCLQQSAQFTRLWPSLATLVLYAFAFYGLSMALRHMPLGLAYAIWAGLGIVLTAAAGFVLYGQRLDAPALLGIGLILSGVVVVNLFSTSASHA